MGATAHPAPQPNFPTAIGFVAEGNAGEITAQVDSMDAAAVAGFPQTVEGAG